MSEVISIAEANLNITKLENEIRKGSLIVLPVEGSYVYLADAFNISAVKRLHELRGDQEGIAASVAISRTETLNGIASNLNEDLIKLANNFWPGLLTIYVQPNSSLAWDLGDGGTLGEFAVRIPDSEILSELTKNIGPLAIASAANSGKGAARNLDEVSALLNEINLYVDGGTLPESQLSTVIRSRVIGLPELEVIRLGAISLKDLQEIVPGISLADPT